MTELQMGLIGLGATAVVGVFAYNKWQEYRQRKLAEALLKPQHEDVLLGEGPKAAPVVRNEPEFHAASPVVAAERREPVLADAAPEDEGAARDLPPSLADADTEVQMASPAAAAPVPEPEIEIPDLPAGLVPGTLLDPRLEFIAAMELVDAVPGAQIVHAQHATLQHLGKPVHWVAFNERTREWERIAPDSEVPVRRLRVGLQLVDRTGPVSDADLATFTEAMHDLADQLLAVADMPASRLGDQAAEIDRFCAAVDLEIGVNLVSRAAPFSGTKIRALAEAAGMVLGDDGAFTRYDDDGRTQFTLQNFETTRFSGEAMRNLTTHGLTFVLDVPRVAHGERVFLQMVDLARRFAETLQGTLVDDNRQPLNDMQLDHIRREFIGKPQATMASYGIPAGSAQALRLFS
ncbi:cell division protein ZipA C-terminal FtsZ-binding domain-containing protein [Dechloromonas sp. H13]|uniref:cell division protein ZipA C-terminal FtsZ-binding domain-containing protein n=1 Tax=Dechloromonas sp. H13 TaxID=2570193 RepID=UPI0012913A46|nr:cell division protein ZipA C-terminal FtsZ-binding domain-containing protein [Dechloromonas sp. H13]